jgi:TRAP-type transport system small permease protein
MRAERFAEYGDITVYLQLPLSPVAWLMAGCCW